MEPRPSRDAHLSKAIIAILLTGMTACAHIQDLPDHYQSTVLGNCSAPAITAAADLPDAGSESEPTLVITFRAIRHCERGVFVDLDGNRCEPGQCTGGDHWLAVNSAGYATSIGSGEKVDEASRPPAYYEAQLDIRYASGGIGRSLDLKADARGVVRLPLKQLPASVISVATQWVVHCPPVSVGAPTKIAVAPEIIARVKAATAAEAHLEQARDALSDGDLSSARVEAGLASDAGADTTDITRDIERATEAARARAKPPGGGSSSGPTDTKCAILREKEKSAWDRVVSLIASAQEDRKGEVRRAVSRCGDPEVSSTREKLYADCQQPLAIASERLHALNEAYSAAKLVPVSVYSAEGLDNATATVVEANVDRLIPFLRAAANASSARINECAK